MLLGRERDALWRQRLEETGEADRRRIWKQTAEKWAPYR
jgi:hypothetical protein